jgi:lia operon protein LiaG
MEERMFDSSRSGSPAALLGALVCFSALPGGAIAQQAETFRLQGDAVAIYNLAGKVQVRGGSGSEVAVSVRRGGSDAGRLAVQTGNVNTRQKGFGTVNSLRVIYPQETIVYTEGDGSSELRVRDDGTFFGDSDSGKKIKIRDSGSGVKAHADLEITVPSGRAVLVALAVGEVRVENVNGRLYVDVASADIWSSDGRGDFVFDTGSGDVEVKGHEGGLVCDTGSGDVVVENVNGGELNFDTGSGNVTGRGIRGSSLRADTGSGDVELLDVSVDRINADTGSGNVTLDLASAPSDILVDVGSGDVLLRLPDGFGAKVDVDTGSGDIETDLPVQVTEIDDDVLRGTIGDGSGRVRVDTGSGDVKFEKR